MTRSAQQYLLVWLRDAHEMEQHAEELFYRLAKQFCEHQEMSRLLHQEANKSKEHQITLSIRLQQLASDVSVVKNLMGKLIPADMHTPGWANGTLVTAVLELHSLNQKGIGAYKILVAAAKTLGDKETQGRCEEMLERYKKRCGWLDKYLSQLAQSAMAKAVA